MGIASIQRSKWELLFGRVIFPVWFFQLLPVIKILELCFWFFGLFKKKTHFSIDELGFAKVY